MTKLELVERVTLRAMSRYGQTFSEALFDDLLKDKLILRPDRMENRGKTPTYRYSWKTYRRVMQIVRLKSGGIVGRDAQRVALFLRGYSQPVGGTKEALRNVYVKSGRAILSSIRSTYADDKGKIPPRRKESLRRSMGEPDDRLKVTEFIFSDDVYINAIRVAKQGPFKLGTQPYKPEMLEQISKGQLPPEFINLISGMLMFGAAEDDESEEIDYVEKLILNSNDKAYLDARAYYQNIEMNISTAGRLLSPNATSSDREIAIKAIVLSVKNVPGWYSLIFVLGLKLVSNSGVTSKS